MELRRPRSSLRGAWASLHGTFGWLVATLLHCCPGNLRADSPEGPKFVLAWGKKGDKPGELVSPIGIAINKKDEVFVTDLNNARVQKFSAEGTYMGGFDLPWDTPKRKSSQAGGIAVDDNGLIYRSFMVQHKVRAYTETGTLVQEWGKPGNGDGDFSWPGGIVLGPGETVFVADQNNHRVQEGAGAGSSRRSAWARSGRAPSESSQPPPARTTSRRRRSIRLSPH